MAPATSLQYVEGRLFPTPILQQALIRFVLGVILTGFAHAESSFVMLKRRRCVPCSRRERAALMDV